MLQLLAVACVACLACLLIWGRGNEGSAVFLLGVDVKYQHISQKSLTATLNALKLFSELLFMVQSFKFKSYIPSLLLPSHPTDQ